MRRLIIILFLVSCIATSAKPIFKFSDKDEIQIYNLTIDTIRDYSKRIKLEFEKDGLLTLRSKAFGSIYNTFALVKRSDGTTKYYDGAIYGGERYKSSRQFFVNKGNYDVLFYPHRGAFGHHAPGSLVPFKPFTKSIEINFATLVKDDHPNDVANEGRTIIDLREIDSYSLKGNYDILHFQSTGDTINEHGIKQSRPLDVDTYKVLVPDEGGYLCGIYYCKRILPKKDNSFDLTVDSFLLDNETKPYEYNLQFHPRDFNTDPLQKTSVDFELFGVPPRLLKSADTQYFLNFKGKQFVFNGGKIVKRYDAKLNGFYDRNYCDRNKELTTEDPCYYYREDKTLELKGVKSNNADTAIIIGLTQKMKDFINKPFKENQTKTYIKKNINSRHAGFFFHERWFSVDGSVSKIVISKYKTHTIIDGNFKYNSGLTGNKDTAFGRFKVKIDNLKK